MEGEEDIETRALKRQQEEIAETARESAEQASTDEEFDTARQQYWRSESPRTSQGPGLTARPSERPASSHPTAHETHPTRSFAALDLRDDGP